MDGQREHLNELRRQGVLPDSEDVAAAYARAHRDVPPPEAPPDELSLNGGGPTSGLPTGDLIEREAQRLRVQREARRIVDAEARPPAPVPEILSLRERLTRPRQPVTWRIEGWQPIGSRVVLAAAYKAGKTTLTGNLTRALVDGAPFLGRYQVAPAAGNVVIVDLEMSAGQLDDWLGDQGIRDDDRVVPIALRGAAGAFDLLDPDVLAGWAKRLRGLDAAYLIVDCLRPILDALGLDEHRDAGRFLVPLDKLLADAGVPEAAVAHHMGHGPERSRGDSRIRDWPDVEWRLVREDPDDPASPRYLSAFGRDVDIPESRLEYDPASRHLTLTGGSRKDAVERAALADVLALLAREPKLSGRSIEEAMAESEHGRDVIRRALKLGVRKGSIATEPGPRNATLYSQCASARECATSAPAQSSECASAPIGRTRTQTRSPARSSAPAGTHGTWTTGDTPEPCAECGHPALLRLDGQPRHKEGCPL